MLLQFPDERFITDSQKWRWLRPGCIKEIIVRFIVQEYCTLLVFVIDKLQNFIQVFLERSEEDKLAILEEIMECV